MLSNSAVELVRELYRGYAIHEVWAPRSINSQPCRRGLVRELVIRNYAREQGETGLPWSRRAP